MKRKHAHGRESKITIYIMSVFRFTVDAGGTIAVPPDERANIIIFNVKYVFVDNDSVVVLDLSDCPNELPPRYPLSLARATRWGGSRTRDKKKLRTPLCGL